MFSKKQKIIPTIKIPLSGQARRRKNIRRKREQDENQAAKAYEDFVASFSATPRQLKNPNITLMQPSVQSSKSTTRKRKKKKVRNIDLFMQEIKLNALSRENEKMNVSNIQKEANNDPLSSNIEILNLSKEFTEISLVRKLSPLGPVGTVIILEPLENFYAAENDKSAIKNNQFNKNSPKNNQNTAFVNFMRRDDALKAVKAIQNGLLGEKIKVSICGRSQKPNFPIIQKFDEIQNEQKTKKNDEIKEEIFDENEEKTNKKGEKLDKKDKKRRKSRQKSGKRSKKDDKNSNSEYQKIVVEFPENQTMKNLIDLVAEFVAIGGSRFEQHVKELHKTDPNFKFLISEGAENNYYRWKTFSLVQNDSVENWNLKPFQIVQDGPFWIPPNKNSVNLKKTANTTQTERKKKRLISERRRQEFEKILKQITKDRNSIKNAMGFCIDHSEFAIEIAEIIMKFMTEEESEMNSKIAKLFLISDILHNSSSNVRNSSAFRTEIQTHLKKIFNKLRESLEKIEGRVTAGKIKEEVLSVLRVWQAWSVYPTDFLDGLERIFLPENSAENFENVFNGEKKIDFDEIDGEPLDSADDIDGFDFVV